MGTRAIITFSEPGESHHLFQHYDGYPTGFYDNLKTWLESGLSWQLPRFESDDAIAGFIAANKKQGGGFRVSKTRTAFSDVEFGYKIQIQKNRDLILTVTITNFWDGGRDELRLWSGKLSEFTREIASEIEEA